jgi:hypothetical protein
MPWPVPRSNAGNRDSILLLVVPSLAALATSGPYVRWRTDCPGREGYSLHQCLVNRDNHAIRFLNAREGTPMNNIIYIVGAIVIIVAILGFLGLR